LNNFAVQKTEISVRILDAAINCLTAITLQLEVDQKLMAAPTVFSVLVSLINTQSYTAPKEFPISIISNALTCLKHWLVSDDENWYPIICSSISTILGYIARYYYMSN
jgi:hypothetical protein